ncbi:hypothetical protein CO651_15155 [Rhizobium phaseoli]|nr:hypothetical protein CO651_15155 [Rhizobium phaseoli]
MGLSCPPHSPSCSALEPSIHTASNSSSRMDPRLKAWDDGECGWHSRQTRRQRREAHHHGRFIRPTLAAPSPPILGIRPEGRHRRMEIWSMTKEESADIVSRPYACSQKAMRLLKGSMTVISRPQGASSTPGFM